MSKHQRKISSPNLQKELLLELKRQRELVEIKKSCPSDNKLSISCDMNIKLLTEKLTTSQTLTNLSISTVKGRLDDWVALFADALKNNHNLKVLHLIKSNINEDEIKLISESLKTNTTLTELMLTNNLLGEGGTRELLGLLETNKTLKKLDINDNQIGNAIITELSHELTRNTSLTSINLENNGIDDKGALQLSQMLRLNSGLNDVNLANNRLITENSYKNIVEVGLFNNCFITNLSITPFNSNHQISTCKDKLIDRNISLIKKFAKYLVSSKPLKLSLESLNYFKHCDKNFLLKFLKYDEEFLQESIKEYLDPKFYQKNFFKLAGICKDFVYNNWSNDGKTNINSLPKILIEYIISFIPIEDYRLDFAGNNNECMETEI